MRVAILSSEAVPFAKTGGLADVAGALTKALPAVGADSFLITPLYDQVDRDLLRGTFIDNLEVEWRGKRPLIRVWHSEALNAPTYLIDAPFYFNRGKIYGEVDDFERFAFFCRAAIALLRRLGEAPDIVHCNDWPCGFAAIELRARRQHEGFFANIRTVFSIHNLAYHGAFNPSDLWWLGFSDASEVMNRKQNARVREKLIPLPARPHFNGRKSAGPIVAIQYVRRVAEPAEQGNRGATKKSEPLKVVWFAVNLSAIEIERSVDQIRGSV